MLLRNLLIAIGFLGLVAPIAVASPDAASKTEEVEGGDATNTEEGDAEEEGHEEEE